MHTLPAITCTTLALLCLANLPGTQAQGGLDQSWVNQPTDFFRRWIHASIILGDYLYIDGGVIQEKVNSSVLTIPVNQTYSIPLSTSWDPSTIEFKRIEKDAPVYNRPNLWPADDNSSFYSFNGDIPVDLGYHDNDPPSNPELWEFRPDGTGGGTWRLYSTTNSVIQSCSVTVTSGNGSAYFLGGYQNWRTTQNNYPNTNDAQSADGLVSYDMTAGTLLNQSITYSYPTGWTWDAHIHYLTGIGKEGLLLAMGGDTSWPGPVMGDTTRVSYDNVAVYNTVTGEWRNQTTTGDAPAGHGGSCSVGVQGQSGTFEIFLYGGEIGASPETQSQVNIDLGQNVYVLSLPSFTWHKSTSPYSSQTARTLHTCQAHNRQMLIIGGVEPNIAREITVADPLPQGLGSKYFPILVSPPGVDRDTPQPQELANSLQYTGPTSDRIPVYDLTDMAFKATYDSSAGPYQTPTQIENTLAKNGRFPQKWDDDKVELWITGKVTSENTTTGSSPTPSPSPFSHSSSNSGAIAGGVVGGVVGALLLAGLAWFMLRRRRRARSQARPGFEKPELEGKDGYRRKGDGDTPAKYQDGGYPPQELSGRQLQEMEGSSGGNELPTKGAR